MEAFFIQTLNRCSKRIRLCEGLKIDILHGFSFPVVTWKPLQTFSLCLAEVREQENRHRPGW